MERIGGGVCLYIKSSLKSYYFSEIELGIIDAAVESIWCAVSCGEESILVGCIYRSGGSDRRVNEQVGGAICLAWRLIDSKKFTGLLIAGDFNFNEIEWPDCENLAPGPGLDFKEILEDNFITQNVNIKTFQIDDGILSNTLDLV